MATTDLANIFIKFKDRNGNLVYNMNDSVSISCADTSSAYYSVHYVKDKAPVEIPLNIGNYKIVVDYY